MRENSESLSVLVVEDEVLIAADLEAILIEHGLRVSGPCVSLDEALVALQAAAPDLALLDLDLGGVSSLPLARELRRRDIPFAFLTGSHVNEAAAREFTDKIILAKPFEPKILLSAIELLARTNRTA